MKKTLFVIIVTLAVLGLLGISKPAFSELIPNWVNMSVHPFPISPHPSIINPVLTASDVTDVPASLVADPFLFHDGDKWFMFFEVFNQGQGDIGLAESTDGINWKYLQIVLDESFHLSYPFVFQYDGKYYMLPETSQVSEVRLYEATAFPTDWRLASKLVTGKELADNTLIFYNNTWWMFSIDRYTHSLLYLHYSDNLMSGWREHPKSPLMYDASKARPGGRFLVWDNGRIIRLGQKCNAGFYGEAVRAFEIDVLTKEDYREHEMPESPVLSKTGTGWNRGGMHHLDCWLWDNNWICAVDGWQFSDGWFLPGDGDWSIGIYTNTYEINPVPNITSTPVLTGQVGSSYQYDVNATGNPSPSYELMTKPGGMEIDSSTGLIQWTPTTTGSFDVTVRAFNIAGEDIQNFTINVVAMSATYTIWTPDVTVGFDPGGSPRVELGVKFSTEYDGYILGIRFYKHPLNTGTHLGSLWKKDGTNLGRVTFTNETASGWQEARFSTPIPVKANTTYVASYHTTTGHFAMSFNYFSSAGVDNPPLHALRSGVDGLNGVYVYNPSSSFPNYSYVHSNYWVDIVFTYNITMDHFSVDPIATPQYMNQPFTVTIRALDAAGRIYSGYTGKASLSVSGVTMDPVVTTENFVDGVWTGQVTIEGVVGEVTISATDGSIAGISNSFSMVDPAPKITSTPVLVGQVGSSYQYDVNATGNPAPIYELVSGPDGMMIDVNTGLIKWVPTEVGLFNVEVHAVNSGIDTQRFIIEVILDMKLYSLWAPEVAVGFDPGGTSGVELGVKFRVEYDGYIMGIRFYKHALNTGIHTGNLWEADGGTNLGRVTFTNETASGWQEARFSTPIPVKANTTYIASYHTITGHFAMSFNYFSSAGVDNPPLHALRSGVVGLNGVYVYNPSSSFPYQSYVNSNFWVDVIFSLFGL